MGVKMLISTAKTYERAMANATSYDEWCDAAHQYDGKMGFNRWKLMDQSMRYDYVSIRVRLDRLRAMRARHDNKGLLFTLNEGIHGNMGGMGNAELYHKAKLGTKKLIVDYVDEIVSALEYIASPEVDDISFEQKLDFFRRAHHCFGSSALMMSGSGMLLYFHMGVVKTLWEHGLLPNVLSGSSGGALVGSIVSTHSDEQMKDFFDPEKTASSIEKGTGLLGLMTSLAPPKLTNADRLEMIGEFVPNMTFQEAYELTGRHLNVSIAPVETHQTSRLLNAVTSPNVFVRDAVLASTAVPGVFPPQTLYAKNDHGERQAYLPSRKWVDGSVSDDLPAKRLARLYAVNHYIVSQTNPHVLPFLSDSHRKPGPVSQLQYAAVSTARIWLNTSLDIMQKPMTRSPLLTKASNMLLSIVNQDYVGDINILPSQRFNNPLKILAHLTSDDIRKLMLMGERSTWPKLEMIRTQTKIGHTLEDILRSYESDFVYNKSSRASLSTEKKAS